MLNLNDTVFRQASFEDASEIEKLYASVKDGEFCTWDEDYPGMFQINQDLEAGTLFVLTLKAKVIGSVSINPENELDVEDCWVLTKGAAEFSRLCLHKDYQGMGLSRHMVRLVENEIRSRGFKGVHIIAALKNIPACSCYISEAYEIRQRVHMFGHEFYAMEKIFDK